MFEYLLYYDGKSCPRDSLKDILQISRTHAFDLRGDTQNSKWGKNVFNRS